MNSTVPRSIAAAIAVFTALCASACSVPLGPGYRVVKESREVQFLPGPPPRLEIRAQYTLQNIGNRDLKLVDVVLPAEKEFGRVDLRLAVGGKEAVPADIPGENDQPSSYRIQLGSPWTGKQSLEIAIEYALTSPGNSGAQITLDAGDFHLDSRGWFPEFQPAKGVLTVYPTPPPLIDCTVRIPGDFLVLAGGAPSGRKKDGNEIDYRFQLRAGKSSPYVVAGRYVASAPDKGSAIFWTAQPAKEDLGTAADRITAAWQTMQTDFGPLEKADNKKTASPYIVESPGLRGPLAGEPGPAAAAFPGGALVNPAALALGTGSDQFTQIVTRAFARDWFGEAIYFSPQAAMGMGEGLPEYAAILIEEARSGQDARRSRVTGYLQRYDQALGGLDETPLGALSAGDPVAQRRIALAKAPLFFVALEDTCGRDAMQKGIANLVARMHGREVGYSDLRAALEETSNRNLSGMFRVWLNEQGIPGDFRTRYQGSAVGEVAER